MGFNALRPPMSGGGGCASATGLTGLNQSGANWSCAWWMYSIVTPENCFVWAHVSGLGPFRNGISARVQQRQMLRVTIGTAGGQTNVDSGEGCLVIGAWTHYATVYDGVAVYFYRNGHLFARVAATTVPAAGGTRLTYVGYSTMNSRVFDVRAFPNKALTLAEVRACTDPRRVVPGCLQQTFRSWVPGASGIVRDESGSGNDLTLSATLGDAQSAPAPPYEDILGLRKPYFGRAPSTIVLAVADALLTLSAEAPALTQANTLALQDALLSLAAESPALTQANQLVLQDALLSLAAEAPALTQAHVLAVADALLTLSGENVVLSLATLLAPADVALALAAESPALTQAHVLALQDALLALQAEAPALTQAHTLALADTLLSLTADNVVLDLAAAVSQWMRVTDRTGPRYGLLDASGARHRIVDESGSRYGVTP